MGKIERIIKNLKKEGGWYFTYLWPYIIVFTVFSLAMSLFTVLYSKKEDVGGLLVVSNIPLFFAIILFTNQVITYTLAKKRNQLKGG